jgi:hypothetical protein
VGLAVGTTVDVGVIVGLAEGINVGDELGTVVKVGAIVGFFEHFGAGILVGLCVVGLFVGFAHSFDSIEVTKK